MKFEKKSLRSRLSRRIFGLFLLTAFIPILTISLVSFKQISEQLDIESKRQVYRESRALGLAMFDRFLSLETNLKLISSALESSNKKISLTEDEWLRSIFSSVFITNNKGNAYRLFGESALLGEITNSQEQHLHNKNTLIQIQLTENQTPGIFLIRSLAAGDDDRNYLVGKINETYMWDLGIYEPDMFCVLNKQNVVLYCSESINPEDRTKLFLGFRESTENNFNYWQINDTEYAVNLWSVFLEAQFQMDEVVVAMARPRKTVLASLEQYKKVFPEALIITGLLVALLSLVQIRRSLVPLEELTKGTNRISRGEFNEPVDIKSGDEFEKLADSFNQMAGRINDQFRTITALADIDRLILSTLDRPYIIETLIRHLHDVVKANHVCVVTIEDLENRSVILNVNQDEDVKCIEQQEITISNEEYAELENCQHYMQLGENQHKSYTKHLIGAGDISFLIYPVRTKDGFTAFICISASETISFQESKLLQLREMADRVAVALSNAAWEEKLYHQAHYDALTQLPNRSFFKQRLEQVLEMARRNQSTVALLFIDLDRFKSINDSLGHTSGDQVLVQMAAMLDKCVRKSETIARFGGDEFVVIVPESKSVYEATKKAIRLSSRILDQMRMPFTLNRREIYITPSIGVAIYPRDADNYDNLLKNADAAMYSAKDEGRDCYKFYSKEHNEHALEMLDLENDLRHAVEREELGLLYQPKISCQTGKVIGAEALIRWEHPRLGTVQPDKFISIAEESGLIAEIGYWVLKTACYQNKAWIDRGGLNITMAVNLSAEQFRQADLFDSIKGVLEMTGMPETFLELEITESITIENFKKTIDALGRLRNLGIAIAIDDFGTGYSSLSYLQQFPINKLKIDRSFINNAPHDEDSTSIIKAIVALAHSLGLSVNSEGVETEEQYDFLRAIDCDEVQGFYISRALAADDFEKFAQNHNV
jgi:diguanylate cyclase (GGDEF)-like protein